MRPKVPGKICSCCSDDAPTKVKMPRKRRHSGHSPDVSSESVQAIEPLPSKRMAVWDPYCWICHQSSTHLRCTSCIRSYHGQCIGASTQHPSKYRCELCIRAELAKENYKQRNVNRDKLHDMLGYTTTRLAANNDFNNLGAEVNALSQQMHSGEPIINPFDLNIVLEKVEESMYKTTLEFLNDIQWIRHNAEIVLTKKDKRIKSAHKMEELCKKDIYDIEMCDQCFCRANTKEEWFTRVCDPPHLLVWARLKGHPYWPAKVIGVSNVAQKKIDVRFFGKHEMGNVLQSDCLLFTEESPNKTFDKHEIERFSFALKEANDYIVNLEKKYSCEVTLANTRCEFDMKRAREFVTKMIPGIDTTDYKLKVEPDFLKKLRHRKPILSSIAKKMAYMKECSVDLERCDHMLIKRLKQTGGGGIKTKSPVNPKRLELKVKAKRRKSQNNRQKSRHIKPVGIGVSIKLNDFLRDSLARSTRNETVAAPELVFNGGLDPIEAPAFASLNDHNEDAVSTIVASMPQTAFRLSPTIFAPMNYDAAIVEPIMASQDDSGNEVTLVDVEQVDDEATSEEIASEEQISLSPETSEITMSQGSDDGSVVPRSESQLSTQSSSASSLSSGYSSMQLSDDDGESLEDLLIKVLKLYGESAKNQDEIRSLKDELRRKIESEQNLKDNIQSIRQRFRIALERIIQRKRLEHERHPHKSTDTGKKLCIVCKKEANINYVTCLNISTCSMACVRVLCRRNEAEQEKWEQILPSLIERNQSGDSSLILPVAGCAIDVSGGGNGSTLMPI